MSTVQVNTTVSNAGGSLRRGIGTTVRIKQKWSHAWQTAPYIQPIRSDYFAAPNISSALFRWDFGEVIQHDRSGFATYTPRHLNDWYISIWVHTRFGTFLAWTGIVTNKANEDFNRDASTAIDSGDQLIGAAGLEYLLKRGRIQGSYTSAGNFIERTLVFNRRHGTGPAKLGNRSSGVDGQGVYTFGTDNNLWTNLNVADYAIAKFDHPGITFKITGDRDSIDRAIEIHDLHGLDVWQCLNRLISRRRGLGWTIFTTGSGVVEIFVFSLLAQSIRVGDITLSANTFATDMDLNADPAVIPNINVRRDQTYRRVLVIGGAIKSCISLATTNGTLEAGWTPEEQDAYEAVDDADRKTDAHLRVFRYFRVPPGWNWAYNSLKDGSPQIANPSHALDGTLQLTTPAEVFNQDRRFLRRIPFDEATTQSGAEPQLRFAFAVAEDPDNAGEYHYIDKFSETQKLSNHSLGVLDREFGIQVRGGVVNHTTGLNHYDTAPPAALTTKTPPEFDFDTMIVTAFVETDERCKVVVFIPNNLNTEAGKDLVIDVPDAEVWFVAAGTVSDLSGKALVYNNGGAAEVVRDDTARLRAIAAMAVAYYGPPRNTIEYTRREIVPVHPVGQLIRAVATGAFTSETIGTVVTRQHYNYEQNSMRITTGYAELDLEALAQ